MGSRPEGRSDGGVSLPPAKPHETMSVLARPRPVVEISLLRQSLGALAERRTCCDHCRRTPLVGERIYLYAATAEDDSTSARSGEAGRRAGGKVERLLCELCRHLRREAPDRSELVHSAESAGSVRVRRA
jgi:hypothetical protein